MSRFPRNLWLALKRPVRLPLPSVNQVMACISLLGLVGLSFMGGAAVMYFRLPPADFFDRAFTGAEAWHERGRLDVYAPAVAPRGIAREEVRVDRPGRTWDGFTLVTTTAGSRAKLLDMRGHVVHRWELPFHKAWPHAPHVADPLPDEQIHWFRCHLFPNGDLLAVYHALGDTPYGYGLVKIDKDSRLLWAYAGRTHHDVEVGEDGTIYTLGQTLLSHPPAGLEFLPSPIIAESVVILSPDGKERDSIPLLEAFRDSPYAALVFDPPPDRTVPPPTHAENKGDLVHVNSVRVLSRALAPKFSLFKPGQLLISLRSTNTLAVLDPHTRSVVWAARGIWQTQHDADFLSNGRILLYDNSGSRHETRVLEYDPVTQAVPWAYSGENGGQFRAGSRGTVQRLPNGNTLIADPDNWLVLEVTPDREVVWEDRCDLIITSARRYGPDELTFLKGAARARP